MRAAQLTRLDGPDAVEVGEIDEPTGDDPAAGHHRAADDRAADQPAHAAAHHRAADDRTRWRLIQT